jgi:hypothetical protein
MAENGTMSTSTTYCQRFFGGKASVRSRLVQAVRSRRGELSIAPDDLDRVCGLGRESLGRYLPKCAEFEKNADLMSGLVFSLVSSLLALQLDRVLNLSLSQPDVDAVKQEMLCSGSRALWGMPAIARDGRGTRRVNRIPLADQARVYVLLRIMQELDEP